MAATKTLESAVKLLKSECGVVPESYAEYNNAFVFKAYPLGMKNKENHFNPYYLVDLKHKAAGPFSPAFDLDGFFKAVESMKPC